MADLGAASWSEVDASNNAVPPNGWPEGMAPSDVNNAARSQMGGEKRWYDRSNATQTTTGTFLAYILTYTATQAALYDGEETSFILHLTCGATPTLNRDGLGAKTMRKYDVGTAAFVSIAAGDFKINQVLRVRYNLAADRYDVISASFAPSSFPLVSTNNTYTGTNNFTNTVTMTGAAFNEAARIAIASAATTDIGALATNYVRITGTTTITSFGTIASGARRHVLFAGALTLTYNATSLILPSNGANITTADGDTALFLSEGAGNWRCLDYQRANGQPLRLGGQIVSTQTGAVATGTTLLPWDDTIPQITEGTEFMTRTITPQSATSTLRIDVVFNFSNSASDVITAALFQDATANALSAVSSTALDQTNVRFSWVMTSGTTSLTTFRVRAGPSGGGTITFNGNSSARKLGGVMASSIIVTEILP